MRSWRHLIRTMLDPNWRNEDTQSYDQDHPPTPPRPAVISPLIKIPEAQREGQSNGKEWGVKDVNYSQSSFLTKLQLTIHFILSFYNSKSLLISKWRVWNDVLGGWAVGLDSYWDLIQGTEMSTKTMWRLMWKHTEVWHILEGVEVLICRFNLGSRFICLS